MRRRSQVIRRLRIPSSPRPVLYAAIFALLLTAFPGLKARAQDTTPPAPPPDQPSAVPESPGQTQIRAVRLSDVEGQVRVYEGETVAFDQAEPNMPVVEGMRIVTADNGRFEVEFEDGSVARVTPDSSIRFTQLRRNADGSTVTQMDALTGLSYYELNGRGGQYTVHFGSDAAEPVKSAVFRVALDTAPLQLAVMHGAVHVDGGMGLSVDVHTNQTFQTDPQQPGAFTTAQNVTAESWDQWNSDRDEALARLETNQTTARASAGNPDNPAWNDLDYYGNWYAVPGYGQVWTPAGVNAGWDPFGNGAWGYYQGMGYTWISGYPWGWMPYHCGAWDYFNSFGWGWIPGNCGFGMYGSGWYPYSTVWNTPPGYAPPLRPRGLPIRHPGQPRPVRIVAVNRGPEHSAPFRFKDGLKPAPRNLNFQGKSFKPLEPGLHPAQRGPLGESFTSSMVRVHPELGRQGFRPTSGIVAGTRGTFNAPGVGTRTFGAPPNFGAPRYGAGYAGGYRGGFSSPGNFSAAHGSFSGAGGGSVRGMGGSSSGGFSGGGGHMGGGAIGAGGVGGGPAPAAGGAAHH